MSHHLSSDRRVPVWRSEVGSNSEKEQSKLFDDDLCKHHDMLYFKNEGKGVFFGLILAFEAAPKSSGPQKHEEFQMPKIFI